MIPAGARRTAGRQSAPQLGPSARIAFPFPKASGRLPTVAVRCGIGVLPSIVVRRTARGASPYSPNRHMIRYATEMNGVPYRQFPLRDVPETPMRKNTGTA